MGLRINIPLPGPFSYSMRATPNLKPLAKSVRDLHRMAHPPQPTRRCNCDHVRPAARPLPPRPHSNMAPGGPGVPSSGAAIGWTIAVFVVLLVIAVIVA